MKARRIAGFAGLLLAGVAAAHGPGAKPGAEPHDEAMRATRGGPATHEEPGGHAAALGRPGNAAAVTRTVEIRMSDAMRFDPPRVRVRAGETLRFVVRNDGRLEHEMVLGTETELREHAEMMRRFPSMEHDDPNAISLDGGESGELLWTFDRPGRFRFACLLPGHMEAGMVGRIEVSARSAPNAEKGGSR